MLDNYRLHHIHKTFSAFVIKRNNIFGTIIVVSGNVQVNLNPNEFSHSTGLMCNNRHALIFSVRSLISLTAPLYLLASSLSSSCVRSFISLRCVHSSSVLLKLLCRTKTDDDAYHWANLKPILPSLCKDLKCELLFLSIRSAY